MDAPDDPTASKIRSAPVAPVTPPARPPADDGVRCVDSIELLGRHKQLLIRHEGRTYRLRITRQNKLILGI
ncbi:MAG TPA: hemin uptake protein HemP [Burkholderiaceae bacterium]|nr:hemin uptake protein HemP [Burkholderiaceae bacterium]